MTNKVTESSELTFQCPRSSTKNTRKYKIYSPLDGKAEAFLAGQVGQDGEVGQDGGVGPCEKGAIIRVSYSKRMEFHIKEFSYFTLLQYSLRHAKLFPALFEFHRNDIMNRYIIKDVVLN